MWKRQMEVRMVLAEMSAMAVVLEEVVAWSSECHGWRSEIFVVVAAGETSFPAAA
jgi:hypothetical protein